MKFLKSKSSLFRYLLLAVFLIGVFFRFYNLNWDSGHFFHPDERNIAASVSRIRFFSQMNPQFFAYGGFPIYLYRATGDVFDYFSKTKEWTYSWEKINFVGRAWSAFFSSLTLIFLYKLAKKVFDKKVAFVALFLMAFTPFVIQTAHYAVTESILAFFIVVLTYLSIQLLKKPSFSQTLQLSLIAGLALATKISAGTFFLTPILAFLYLLIKSLKKGGLRRFTNIYLKLFHFLVLSFLIFVIVSPYTFLDFQHFKESMNYEGGIVSGKLIVVYVYQFIKTLPYIYWVQNWFFTQGPLLASTSIVGFLYVIWLTIKKRNMPLFLLIAWPLVYFAIVGNWFTKFVRYLFPLYPFLILYGAKFLIDIMDFSKKFKILSLVTKFTLWTTLATTFLYGLAFMSIYTHPQTRITASKWVYANIPFGAKILTEHWDDGLPLPIKEGYPGQYQTEQLTIYEPDNQQKLAYYAGKLADADYIILNSRRLYGTLINLPEKYPITSQYYKLLFAGELGYNKIAEFSSYPKIFGLTINDDTAEETFQVYDHPRVLVFKNMAKFSQQIIQDILSVKL